MSDDITEWMPLALQAKVDFVDTFGASAWHRFVGRRLNNNQTWREMFNIITDVGNELSHWLDAQIPLPDPPSPTAPPSPESDT